MLSESILSLAVLGKRVEVSPGVSVWDWFLIVFFSLFCIFGYFAIIAHRKLTAHKYTIVVLLP